MKYFFILLILLFSLSASLVFFSRSYLKKLVGAGLCQSCVIIFYLALGKINGSIAPIIANNYKGYYTSPIPTVLMLTAIVVGFAIFCVGLSILNRIIESKSDAK